MILMSHLISRELLTPQLYYIQYYSKYYYCTYTMLLDPLETGWA